MQRKLAINHVKTLKTEKALFIKHYSTNAKFVLNDYEILKKFFSAEFYDAKIKNNLISIFEFLRQFFFLLFNIRKFGLIYIWFADYHSFLPVFFAKLFGRKSVIAVGGYDATYIPEIDMGLFTKTSLKKRFRCFCAGYSLKNCSLILPVDKSLIENTNKYIYSDLSDKPVLKDGIKNMIPGIKTSFKTLPLGYDPDLFKKNPEIKKENAVVSAGYIMNENEFRRKGFDMLFESAKILSDIKFIFIGLNDFYFEKLKSSGLRNIELYKQVSYDELIKLYSRAKVYSQLSLFEGMPSAVCEAMLCECIPVGSDVNGIPDIIGSSGFIVKEKNIDLVAEAFKNAIMMDESKGVNCRQRIIEQYPLQKRESELTEILKGLQN